MKMFNKLFKKNNKDKYEFLFIILLFALMSAFFFNKHKTENIPVIDRNATMHWGFPMSRPPAPRMRNF